MRTMIESMTPGRLAEVTARNHAANGMPYNRIVAALCRALADAWRERDMWRERCEGSHGTGTSQMNEAAIDGRHPTHR